MTEKNTQDDDIQRVINPLVFISHDTRDAKLAEAFSSLLKSVSAGVLKSFRTSDKKGTQGIEYGVEWYPEIIRNIQNASDVVCLLTKQSVNRPWILFEAGMAKGKLETPILGVALGIPLKDASTGPFAQFQNCADDEESLTKLVFQLVDRIPNSEPDEDTIKFQVGKFKKTIAEILKTETTESTTKVATESSKDTSAKLFEEIKVMFQDLPSRIQGNLSPDYSYRKQRRFHPKMMVEMTHMFKNNKVGILFGLGMLRDGMPWIYEVGMETIRVIDSNAPRTEKEQGLFEFQNVVKMSTRLTTMMEEFMDSKNDFMFYEDISRMLIREMQRYMEHKSNKNITKS